MPIRNAGSYIHGPGGQAFHDIVDMKECNCRLSVTKRPIDLSREAAAFMQVGDASDASGIREMMAVDGRMLIVKEGGIWQVQLADDIDPERVNPSIPNAQQKMLSVGTRDAIVCQTLLQAKVLLRKDLLGESCDPESLESTAYFDSDETIVTCQHGCQAGRPRRSTKQQLW